MLPASSMVTPFASSSNEVANWRAQGSDWAEAASILSTARPANKSAAGIPAIIPTYIQRLLRFLMPIIVSGFEFNLNSLASILMDSRGKSVHRKALDSDPASPGA